MIDCNEYVLGDGEGCEKYGLRKKKALDGPEKSSTHKHLHKEYKQKKPFSLL